MIKTIFTGSSLFFLLGCAGASSAAPGFVEGHVDIGPLTPVQRIDVTPTVPPQMYAAYKIVILREDGQTEVTRADIDAQGNYRVALPPGKYVLNVPHRGGLGGVAGVPKPVTIVSAQSVRVDISIDTGIR